MKPLVPRVEADDARRRGIVGIVDDEVDRVRPGRPARSAAIVSRATRSCCPRSDGNVIRQSVQCTSVQKRPRSPSLTAATSAPEKAWSDA